MCVCSEAGRKRCEQTLERVVSDVSPGHPEGLLTGVIFGLQFDLPNECIGHNLTLNCDQWAGISLTILRSGDDGKYVEHAHIWVQCDEVEHGLARVWELANEAATLKVVVNEG